MLLTKSHSRPTILYRFSAQVSITRPGQFVNTTMADIIKVWQDYVSEQLDDNGTDDDDDDDDDDELLDSAVHYLMKTLGSFDYSDILLTTQVFHWFLADRTNGRAYATVLRLSVDVVVCDVMYCG